MAHEAAHEANYKADTARGGGAAPGWDRQVKHPVEDSKGGSEGAPPKVRQMMSACIVA